MNELHKVGTVTELRKVSCLLTLLWANVHYILQIGVTDVEISGPPACYEMEYQTLLTPEAVKFVVELVRQFDKDVDQVIMCFSVNS